MWTDSIWLRNTAETQLNSERELDQNQTKTSDLMQSASNQVCPLGSHIDDAPG